MPYVWSCWINYSAHALSSDERGSFIGPFLVWRVETQQRRQDAAGPSTFPLYRTSQFQMAHTGIGGILPPLAEVTWLSAASINDGKALVEFLEADNLFLMEGLIERIVSLFLKGSIEQKTRFSHAALETLPHANDEFAEEIREILSKEPTLDVIRDRLGRLRGELPVFGSEYEDQRRCLMMLLDLWCENDQGVIFETAEWFVECVAPTMELRGILSDSFH